MRAIFNSVGETLEQKLEIRAGAGERGHARAPAFGAGNARCIKIRGWRGADNEFICLRGGKRCPERTICIGERAPVLYKRLIILKEFLPEVGRESDGEYSFF